MALQIRRGTTAERLTITPLPGELIYDTTLQELYVGDGTTVGGVPGTSSAVFGEAAVDNVAAALVAGSNQNVYFVYGAEQDAANRIDAYVDLSNYDGEIVSTGFRGPLYADDSGIIVDTSTGNITANDINAGNIVASSLTVDTLIAPYLVADFTGSVFADNSTVLVNGPDASINLDGTVKGDIIPDQDSAYDLGSSSYKFKDLYLSGSSLYLGSATITSTGSAVNLPIGSTIGGIAIGTSDLVPGSNYNINIIGDDSSLLVDSASSTITVNNVDATDITANSLATAFLDTVTSSQITVRGSMSIQSDLVVENDIFGRFTGQITTDDPIRSQTSNYVYFDDGVWAKHKSRFYATGSDIDPIRAYIFTENPTAAGIFITKSRGTEDTPSLPVNQDRLGTLSFTTWNGTDFVEVAGVMSIVEGTVSSGIVPTSLKLRYARQSDGLTVEGISIGSNGIVVVGPQSGTYGADGHLQIISNSYSSDRGNGLVFSQHHDYYDSNRFNFLRSRGSGFNLQAVQNGDRIGTLAFHANDGSSPTTQSGWRTTAMMHVEVDGVPAGSDIRSKFIWRLNDGSAGFIKTKAELTNNGTFYVDNIQGYTTNLNVRGDVIGSVYADDSSIVIDGGLGGKITAPSVTASEFVKFPVYADSSARNTAIPSPEVGMVVFVTDVTELQVNTDGTTGGWVALN
jgi:hypothetical protein